VSYVHCCCCCACFFLRLFVRPFFSRLVPPIALMFDVPPFFFCAWLFFLRLPFFFCACLFFLLHLAVYFCRLSLSFLPVVLSFCLFFVSLFSSLVSAFIDLLFLVLFFVVLSLLLSFFYLLCLPCLAFVLFISLSFTRSFPIRTPFYSMPNMHSSAALTFETNCSIFCIRYIVYSFYGVRWTG